MTTPDLNAGDLPHLSADRPRHRSSTHCTTRELFGHDGQFFTVPGTFPGGMPDHIGFTPAVYAVLRTPNLGTGEDEFTVRDVDGHRHTLGTPAPDRGTAVRSALSALADDRRAHAQRVEHNRVHILGLAPVPPVRIGHIDTGTCVVPVRCSCLQVEGLAAHFEHVSLAAGNWLDETPTTPWEICPTSPTRVTAPSGSGPLTATFRNAEGAAVVEFEHPDGHREAVALARVNDLA
ncbi:hypothetical protein OG883_42650 [Streptomyces sp. NBC_01142]|uniref:hypothetical protein n=1 Tax=Streptomyces sp. NBC_01142 TaxID=2975865 RepID=UPI002256D2EC|nr:hypothetical protein [Streptomyces sp. NBC_01142]MCX4826344.1 hypothetical protein [Streptomyces sp. NBC_01142]